MNNGAICAAVIGHARRLPSYCTYVPIAERREKFKSAFWANVSAERRRDALALQGRREPVAGTDGWACFVKSVRRVLGKVAALQNTKPGHLSPRAGRGAIISCSLRLGEGNLR
jgi:hypothetical protein